MKNGIIYTIFDWLIDSMKYLNIVELFKWVAIKLFPKNKITARRISVDIYIILKWSIILILWLRFCDNLFATILVWYLLGSNLYTYFYHHVWTDDLAKGNFTFERIKRRFFNLMQALFYNVFGFAYLFALPYQENFNWSNNILKVKDAIGLSLANSMTVDYKSITAISEVGHNLLLIETLASFIFLTIILSNSIPEIKE